ncbi:MAG: hypothetical protein ACYC2X_04165 [Coriobacteriia bacterium]
MAEAWIITCDERRVGALTTGALEAGVVLAGTTIADVGTLKDAGGTAANAGVSVLVLDAASSPSEAAVKSTIAAIRLVRGDAVRILLVVDELTRPGESLVVAALNDGVRDIVAASPDELAGMLAMVLSTETSYADAMRWRGEDAPTASRTGFAWPVTSTKAHVVERVVEVERVKWVGTPIVTVAGAQHRVGATHLALSLGRVLQAQGLRAAVIVPAVTLAALGDTYELDFNGLGRGQRTDFDGLTLATDVTPGDLADAEVVVWDTGVYEDSAAVFKLGAVRCLVFGGCEWELGPISAIVSSEPEDVIAGFTYCVTLATEDDFAMCVEDLAGLSCVRIAFPSDWKDGATRSDLAGIVSAIVGEA